MALAWLAVSIFSISLWSFTLSVTVNTNLNMTQSDNLYDRTLSNLGVTFDVTLHSYEGFLFSSYIFFSPWLPPHMPPKKSFAFPLAYLTACTMMIKPIFQEWNFCESGIFVGIYVNLSYNNSNFDYINFLFCEYLDYFLLFHKFSGKIFFLNNCILMYLCIS